MDDGLAVSAVLAADLSDLSGALDLSPETAGDLAAALEGFYRDAFLGVPSLMGMSLVCTLPEGEAALTALQPSSAPDDIATSLAIPVRMPGTAGLRCLFVLYAARPGALKDLAAGLRESLGEDPDPVLLDAHLEPPVTDLSVFPRAAVHQMAEGALLGRGFSEIGAVTFLEALTAASGGDTVSAARQVIQSVR